MSLPKQFVFSQSRLQDYLDCPRRFELKYIQELKWPAVESEPVLERERHMQRGADFHQMVQQHLHGVPAAVLSARAMDDKLRGWWEKYLASDVVESLPTQHYVETQFATQLLGYRLVAKVDLLAVGEGRVVIVDWKTTERKPKNLASAMQTRVYRYVLGTIYPPEQIEMLYWFTEHPPEHLTYSREQFEADRADLETLIREIEGRTVFDLTTDTRRCQFCVYRSLCERGVQAGDDETIFDEDIDLEDFDLDQIAEVEF